MIDLENNELYSFGWNRYGQLGIGNDTNQSRPQLVLLEMLKINFVSCGTHHTFVSTSKIKIWN